MIIGKVRLLTFCRNGQRSRSERSNAATPTHLGTLALCAGFLDWLSKATYPKSMLFAWTTTPVALDRTCGRGSAECWLMLSILIVEAGVPGVNEGELREVVGGGENRIKQVNCKF